MLIIDRIQASQPEQIITIDLPISERDRQKMAIDILDIKDQQSRSSNVKADMSSWRLWNEMDVSPLMNVLFPLLDDARVLPWNTAPIALAGDPVPTCLLDLWSAVYRKGDKTVAHQHKPAVGAFVYYVQTTGDSAPLEFPFCNLSVQPRMNSVIIFPGYMVHSVPELTEDDERIVIAGNFVRTGVNDALILGREALTYDAMQQMME